MSFHKVYSLNGQYHSGTFIEFKKTQCSECERDNTNSYQINSYSPNYHIQFNLVHLELNAILMMVNWTDH